MITMYIDSNVDGDIGTLYGGTVCMRGHSVPAKTADSTESSNAMALSRYHDSLITAVLRRIRSGGVDYVFSSGQLNELRKHSPAVQHHYQDGIYTVWMSHKHIGGNNRDEK